MVSIKLAISASVVIWTFPTATDRHSTFFSWNLIVEETSSSFAAKSSVCEMGVGNFPTIWGCGQRVSKERGRVGMDVVTSGPSQTKQSRDLPEYRLGGEKGVVLATKFFDELLVSVESLEIIDGHGVGAMMLCTVDIVLVPQKADELSARCDRKAHGAREPLVPLHVVALEGDL